ncbi:hypothetical protein FKP32DRAFT_1585289 [Trametes sanguinea]|nr:hypothetical protein FKP32DRAFT_1585289 [Trametes sanguinea]
MDILRILAVFSKVPIALLILFYVSTLVVHSVTSTAASALTPICAIAPRLSLCAGRPSISMPTAARGADTQRVDFPGLMDLQSRTLDRLLSQSATGTQLALNVKQAELAIKDLTTLVLASNLTSKDELAAALKRFTADATVTGRGLQRLSAKLYGAVDRILAFNEYATRRIASGRSSVAKGDIDLAESLRQTFQSSFSILSSEVARVTLETARVSGQLDALEERLSIVHALCEYENVLTSAAMDSLFAELWTWLGGNRKKLAHLNQHLFVLENVGRYRSLAVAHVAATSEALASIEAQLGELHDKLNTPDAQDDISIEVQIASIERSAIRLREQRLWVDGYSRAGSFSYGREGVGRMGEATSGYGAVDEKA